MIIYRSIRWWFAKYVSTSNLSANRKVMYIMNEFLQNPKNTSSEDVNTPQKEAPESQLSVIDIINMMLAFWWLLVVMGIVVGGGTYAYTKITSIPEYKSECRLYINTIREQTNEDVNAVGIKNAADLLPTYIEVLSSGPFMENISDDIENKYSVNSLNNMISYSALTDTNIIDISVIATDSHDAYVIAKSIMRNAPAKIQQIFEGGSVKAIEYPVEATSTQSTHAFRNGIIGFMAGIILAAFVVFVINIFDTRVKNPKELTASYGLPVLGEIPNIMEL